MIRLLPQPIIYRSMYLHFFLLSNIWCRPCLLTFSYPFHNSRSSAFAMRKVLFLFYNIMMLFFSTKITH